MHLHGLVRLSPGGAWLAKDNQTPHVTCRPHSDSAGTRREYILAAPQTLNLVRNFTAVEGIVPTHAVLRLELATRHAQAYSFFNAAPKALQSLHPNYAPEHNSPYQASIRSVFWHMNSLFKNGRTGFADTLLALIPTLSSIFGPLASRKPMSGHIIDHVKQAPSAKTSAMTQLRVHTCTPNTTSRGSMASLSLLFAKHPSELASHAHKKASRTCIAKAAATLKEANHIAAQQVRRLQDLNKHAKMTPARIWQRHPHVASNAEKLRVIIDVDQSHPELCVIVLIDSKRSNKAN